MRLLAGFAIVLTLGACASRQPTLLPAPTDDYLWLEEVQGAQALAWVKERNTETESALEKLPSYKRNEAEARKIILAKDRIPFVYEMNTHVYNFWRDDVHVRGIWRRTTIAKYKSKNPQWELVLDLDQLAKKEKENWVYSGAICYPPEYMRCLLQLSRGGKDAIVIREFDMHLKAFVQDGFSVAEARTEVAWVDENTLVVATDFGPGTLTKSDYPRITKFWKRGQPLAEARVVFEGKTDDLEVTPFAIHTPRGKKVLIRRNMTYYTDELFELTPELALKQITKPADARYWAWINGQDIFLLRSNWTVRNEIFKAGSLIALPPLANAQPKPIFTPNQGQSISTVLQAKDTLLVDYLDNIQGKVARAYLKDDTWQFEDLPFPEKGVIWLHSANPFSDLLIFGFESFLTPTSAFAARVSIERTSSAVKPQFLRQIPHRFESRHFQSEQLWAKSADGTQVPYFLVSRKNSPRDGSTPVLIFGYGGFEMAETPRYLATIGKSWLEKGGAYVVANIRGGGEFGPKWHQAALKENRQRAFDDFISVAEDLVARKISGPQKMAIWGGSNGGLLVGSTFVQRPDLYGAVICEVPLLDMLRYNKLLVGASWEGEYGSPEDPKVRPALLKYSPYQNIKPGVKYPEVLFITSTADDRVHPAHARKMVAKMQAQGHKHLYYENIEGGHSGAANLLQRVKFAALRYTFLQDRLLSRKK